MTKPLSMGIRDRAMARLDPGETVREVADGLSMAPSRVVKWSPRPDGIGVHLARFDG